MDDDGGHLEESDKLYILDNLMLLALSCNRCSCSKKDDAPSLRVMTYICLP